MKKINVIMVDDHELILEGIRKTLSLFPEIVITGEARSAEELHGEAVDKSADIILLDIDLPGRSGFEALADVKTLFPRARVLFLSMFPEDQFAVRALKAGAHGYVTKKAVAQELVDAIRTIAAGKKYLSPGVEQQLLQEIGYNRERSPLETLSDRELSVLRLIAKGKSAGAIASQLSLSVNTVTTYRRRLLKKLDMKTNAELVRFALENRIII